MDLQLQDRVVLVVGGAGFIGSAITAGARAEGATVIVASRTSGMLMDARDDRSARAVVAGLVAEYGRLDALVVSAAPAAQAFDPDLNGDPAQVAQAFDGKAIAFLRLARAVIPAMVAAGYGRIVGVSGQNAYLTGNIAGSVRNAAMNVIAKNLADELAATGVAVNVVAPGLVREDPVAGVDIGMAGAVSPRQVADLVGFLISPRCGISGEDIAVGHRVRGTL